MKRKIHAFVELSDSALEAARTAADPAQSVARALTHGGRRTWRFEVDGGVPHCTICHSPIIIVEDIQKISYSGKRLQRYLGTCSCPDENLRTFVPTPVRLR